jgi:hypothetical protein
MKTSQFPQSLLLIALLFQAGVANAQSKTLTVNGHAGEAQVIQVNGKSYVDVEALARITNGSLAFQANQISLTIGVAQAAPSTPAPADKTTKAGFSKEFLRAGIETMTVIREWRIAIVNAVQTGNPVTDSWVTGYRTTAQSKLALVSVAATTNSDRQALPMLQSEFNNMQKLSDTYLQKNANREYVAPDALASDPLDQQIITCARALASMAANGQFEDVPSCH